MIQKYVDRFEANRDELRRRIEPLLLGRTPVEGQLYVHGAGAVIATALVPCDELKYGLTYDQLVFMVVSAITEEDDYGDLDPLRIVVIDHGDYQGSLLYVIAARGYQPDVYWAVRVGYGSCSGCDTLQALEMEGSYDDEDDKQKAVDGVMTLALHIVQGLRVASPGWRVDD